MAGYSRKQTLESFTGYVKEIPDRAIIVGCHCDTDFKMKLTTDLLIKIRDKFKDNIFSNTSSLSAYDLGENINILHFMNPITTPIVDVYKTENYKSEDLEKILKSLKDLSFNIIEVKNIPGFLVNRILFKNLSYFFYLLESEKNNINDLRKIYKNIFNNDPVKIVNMIGLDTCLNILKNLNKSDKSFYVSKLISDSVKNNVLGYKNKKLFKI